ncbi:hypothetical protein RFI_26542 [Reticulomyxa filosa]|uniref:Uncharacterized protein n=1 Tax=Reticulomyxa filosa TaxID=46433 RepID=X6MB18_RETFI|nr:hypothetical protein RFI_26542 [Reticulomyxa filosa]|eukprot:ETO10836.1 hypothetical protein RFI_26542 [Reticulomyxa filosa]
MFNAEAYALKEINKNEQMKESQQQSIIAIPGIITWSQSQFLLISYGLNNRLSLLNIHSTSALASLEKTPIHYKYGGNYCNIDVNGDYALVSLKDGNFIRWHCDQKNELTMISSPTFSCTENGIIKKQLFFSNLLYVFKLKEQYIFS